MTDKANNSPIVTVVFNNHSPLRMLEDKIVTIQATKHEYCGSYVSLYPTQVQSTVDGPVSTWYHIWLEVWINNDERTGYNRYGDSRRDDGIEPCLREMLHYDEQVIGEVLVELAKLNIVEIEMA